MKNPKAQEELNKLYTVPTPRRLEELKELKDAGCSCFVFVRVLWSVGAPDTPICSLFAGLGV